MTAAARVIAITGTALRNGEVVAIGTMMTDVAGVNATTTTASEAGAAAIATTTIPAGGDAITMTMPEIGTMSASHMTATAGAVILMASTSFRGVIKTTFDMVLGGGVLAAATGTTMAGMTGMAGLANGAVEATALQVTTTMLHVGAVARMMPSDVVGAVTRKTMTRTAARLTAMRDRAAGVGRPETQAAAMATF